MKLLPEEKSLNVVLTLEDGILKISLALPVSSSQKAEWSSIKAKYAHQPILSPESLEQENIINVQIPCSNTLDLHTEEKLQTSGDVDNIPSRQDQKARQEKDINFLHLYLEPKLKLSEGNPASFVLQLKTNDSLIQGIILALISELKSSGWDSCLPLEREGAILSFYLRRQYATWQQSAKLAKEALNQYNMRQVVDYINNHLDQDLSLAKLAAIAQTSLYHFARQFKQSIGSPPHQYLTHCRIEKAKQLLTNKDLSIIEITHQIGFQSQSHFTNLFRRSVGVTPSMYRVQL